jgi:hypothetical protein
MRSVIADLGSGVNLCNRQFGRRLSGPFRAWTLVKIIVIPFPLGRSFAMVAPPGRPIPDR